MQLARLLVRAQSTAPVAAAAAAAAAPAVVAPMSREAAAIAKDVADFRKRSGQVVTQSWNRYTHEPRGSYTLADARSAAVLAATREWTVGKRAVIKLQAKPSMQTGHKASRWWTIQWDKRPAWANPLMGWVSSADTHQALNMHTKFETADQAIALCERNGWRYELQRPFSRVPGRVDSAYAYNFVPVATQARLDTLGARKARHLFEHDQRRSQWVNWRRTPFGAEPWKPATYQTQAAWTGPAWPAPKMREANQHEADA